MLYFFISFCFLSHCHVLHNQAGDVLQANEIANAFARAQGSPCKHSESRLFAFMARFFIRDLYEVIRFYRQSTETTDITVLEKEFPGQLTSFAEFLEETDWSNPNLSFENLQNMSAACGGTTPRPQ